MKYLSIVFFIVVAMVTVVACGGGAGTGDTPAASKGDDSSGASEISVNFSADEENSPGVFQLKETVGFISGMRYNAQSTAKLAYVAFANYPVELSPYGAVMPPKEMDQIAIVVAFKTENKEVPMEQQMEEYNKMTVPTGTYPLSWMGNEKSVQVSYQVGQKDGVGISGEGASGNAVLTVSTPERVSGSIDFRSEKGSTIKGTFDVKIEKDFWKR